MQKKLGELLIEKGILTPEKLKFYLHLQKEKRRAGATVEMTRLGQLLIIDGFFDQKALVLLLEEQFPGQVNSTATIFSEDMSFLEPTPPPPKTNKMASASPKSPPTASKLLVTPKSSPILIRDETEEKAVQQMLETMELGDSAEIHKTQTILEVPRPHPEPEEKAKTELFISYERLPQGSSPQPQAKSPIPPKSQPALVKETERYEVLQTIGALEGDLGEIELLKDRFLGREVARKRLKITSSQLKNLSVKQKFFLWKLKREAGITALLEHPNILPLYEVSPEPSAEIQFVLRKTEGNTLRTFLQSLEKGETTFNEIQILNLFRKICEAVAYAHTQGIVHRDLKPENIEVGKYGEVYVLNWGSAKQIKELKEDFSWLEAPADPKTAKEKSKKAAPPKGILGTEGYLSPEQRDDVSSVNSQTDIYALGRILKECYLHAGSAHPLPEAILTIEKKATEKNLNARYFLLQELLDDLEQYQKSQTTKASEDGLLRIFLNWSQKNPIRATLFLVAVGTFFLTGIYFQWKAASAASNAFKEEQEKKKSKLIQLQNESQKQLKQHLQKLEEITLRFYKKKQSRETTLDAQFEISKMKEAEVFERLKKILSDGIQYITESSHPDPNRIAFYEMIFGAVGYLEKPEAGEVLLEILKTLVKKITAYPREQEVPEQETNLMVQLAYAFKNTRSVPFFKQFQELREELRFRKSPFFKRTVLVCEHLQEILIEDYSAKIAENTEDASLYHERGNAKRAVQDWLGAIADYDTALRLNLQSPQIYLDRGHAKKGNSFFDEAINDYTEAIALNPELAIAYYYRGLARQSQSDTQEAINDFSKAIRIHPQEYMAYLQRALLRDAKGETKDVFSDLAEAIKLNPQESNAYFHRGMIKLKKDDLDESIADFNSAIREDPQNMLAYLHRGHAKEQKKDWEGALLDYNYVIRSDPEDSENTDVYYHRGRMKKEIADRLGAIEDFTSAIRLNPEHFGAYLYRGIIKSDQEDFDPAINDFLEAIHLKPQDAEAYFHCGYARFKKNDLNGALDHYTNAIRFNSQDFSYVLNRGLIHLNKKDLAKATEDFTTAIELNAYCAEAYYHRGCIRLQSGDFNGAILDFTAIDEKSAPFPSFHYELASAYFQKGDKTKAKGEFQKFLDAVQMKLDPSIRKKMDETLTKFPELRPTKK